MTEKKSKNYINILTLIVAGINLVITTGGGYYYIGQYEAASYKAESLNKELNYSINLLNYLNDLQPRFDVSTSPDTRDDGTRKKMYFDIKNIGKYDINIEVIDVKLFKRSEPNGIIEIPLSIITNNGKSNIDPNTSIRKEVVLDYSEQQAKPFYYEAKIKARLESPIVKLSKEIGSKNHYNIIDEYYEKTSTISGYITEDD